MRGVAPVPGKLLRSQLAYIGQALFDQALGQLIGLLEIIRAIEKPVVPVKPKPVDVLLDGVHELGVLFGGIGVVHAQVADAAELLRGAEIDAQGLAVADMQISVGLRREAGVDLHAFVLSARADILCDELMNEITELEGFFHG